MKATKNMPKRSKFQILLSIPLAIMMFLAGWLLYYGGTTKVKSKPVKTRKKDVNNVQFRLLAAEEKEIAIAK